MIRVNRERGTKFGVRKPGLEKALDVRGLRRGRIERSRPALKVVDGDGAFERGSAGIRKEGFRTRRGKRPPVAKRSAFGHFRTIGWALRRPSPRDGRNQWDCPWWV